MGTGKVVGDVEDGGHFVAFGKRIVVFFLFVAVRLPFECGHGGCFSGGRGVKERYKLLFCLFVCVYYSCADFPRVEECGSVGASGRGVLTNRPCLTFYGRLMRSHTQTGSILFRCGGLHPSSVREHARVLGRFLNTAKGRLLIRRPFHYSCNCGVHINRGFCTGVKYAVLSRTLIVFKSGMLLTPGIDVCATKRTMGIAQHVTN